MKKCLLLAGLVLAVSQVQADDGPFGSPDRLASPSMSTRPPGPRRGLDLYRSYQTVPEACYADLEKELNDLLRNADRTPAEIVKMHLKIETKLAQCLTDCQDDLQRGIVNQQRLLRYPNIQAARALYTSLTTPA